MRREPGRVGRGLPPRRFEQRGERKCRPRDANRDVILERLRERGDEGGDVQVFTLRVDERAVFAVAANLRDVAHHVAERRALAIRNEQQITQRQLVVALEHEVIESRKQRGVVERE